MQQPTQKPSEEHASTVIRSHGSHFSHRSS